MLSSTRAIYLHVCMCVCVCVCVGGGGGGGRGEVGKALAPLVLWVLPLPFHSSLSEQVFKISVWWKQVWEGGAV